MDECKVGRTPWSAADAHVGLLVIGSLPRCGARGTRADQGVRPISAKLSPHGPVFGVQSPAHRSDSGTFSTAAVFILALMGVRPTTLVEAFHSIGRAASP